MLIQQTVMEVWSQERPGEDVNQPTLWFKILEGQPEPAEVSPGLEHEATRVAMGSYSAPANQRLGVANQRPLAVESNVEDLTQPGVENQAECGFVLIVQGGLFP